MHRSVCVTAPEFSSVDANSQVAAHSTRPIHTFKFDEAEILARRDNRVSRELLESWFTGPHSINKCNDIPTPYSVLKHGVAQAIDHSRSATAGGVEGAVFGEEKLLDGASGCTRLREHPPDIEEMTVRPIGTTDREAFPTVGVH
nr:unnamed protein product [Spirometra erinaceieuropaei]